MSVARPRLADIGVPTFDEPATCPEIPADRYPERIDALRRRMRDRGYDRVVVWADREHSAGISFLTGFDPRFEEIKTNPESTNLIMFLCASCIVASNSEDN